MVSPIITMLCLCSAPLFRQPFLEEGITHWISPLKVFSIFSPLVSFSGSFSLSSLRVWVGWRAVSSAYVKPSVTLLVKKAIQVHFDLIWSEWLFLLESEVDTVPSPLHPLPVLSVIGTHLVLHICYVFTCLHIAIAKKKAVRGWKECTWWEHDNLKPTPLRSYCMRIFLELWAWAVILATFVSKYVTSLVLNTWWRTVLDNPLT